MTRLRIVAWPFVLLALAACSRQPQASPALKQIKVLTQAEAAPSDDWNATTPPAVGGVPVQLMDYWNKRWPHRDGVVWYRLHWNQTNANAPIDLLLDYVCMADVVWVNGSMVYRDPHLVEPLSQSWIAPQYFLLDKPLLHAGENTLLARISDLAVYQRGFGVIEASPNKAPRCGWTLRWPPD